ncbi:MAG: hypothetical protein WCF81_04700 [Roseiarcus sp.]
MTTALRERLARLEQTGDFDEARYQKLKTLVKDSRKLWSDALFSVDHGDRLYAERGQPK